MVTEVEVQRPWVSSDDPCAPNTRLLGEAGTHTALKLIIRAREGS